MAGAKAAMSTIATAAMLLIAVLAPTGANGVTESGRRGPTVRHAATVRRAAIVRHAGTDRAPRGDRPDRDPDLRAKYIKGRGDGRRDKAAPDPNSPFAKLAALKEQLESSTKEPR